MGTPASHHALDELITAFEGAFPGRVRGYYLLGSHADDSAIVTSDLDLTVVFKDRVRDEEREKAKQLAEGRPGEIDIEIDGEEALAGGITPTFKFGSILLHGEDVRSALPLMSLDDWTRDRMHAAYFLAITVFNRPIPVTTPLPFPDRDGEFLGYAARTVRLPNGTEAPSTRNLIRVTGWMAAARLADEAGVFVARKRDCHALYARHIGDEWTPLVVDLYERCRGEWGYLIPDSAEDRRALRSICHRTLAFERNFLERYKTYLLSELRDGQERARWVMERVPWKDVESAL